LNSSEEPKDVRIYAIVEQTRNLGPGKRVAIWFQGCPFDCPGCITPDSQNRYGGENLPLEDILGLLSNTSGFDGVTISGGEPFAQAGALRVILKHCRSLNLSTIVFTGFSLSKLRSTATRNADVAACLTLIDVLVDGLFEEAQIECDGMRGSANQSIHFLTERLVSERDALLNYDRSRSELALTGGGPFLIGVPGPGMATAWNAMSQKK